METPDHPDIASALRTGYPSGNKDREPICPVCGDPCETIYIRQHSGTVLGCDCCIDSKDAWEAHECFPENERSIWT